MAKSNQATPGDKPVGKPNKAKPPKKPTKKQEKIVLTKKHHPDLTTREIAAVCDTDHSYVVRTLQDYGIKSDLLERYKSNRADILSGLQMRLLSSITDADIETASLMQRSASFGILFDKERLERGQSTLNSMVLHADIQALRGKPPEAPNSHNGDSGSMYGTTKGK